MTNESVPTYAHVLRNSPSTPTGLSAAASPSLGEESAHPPSSTKHATNNADIEATVQKGGAAHGTYELGGVLLVLLVLK